MNNAEQQNYRKLRNQALEEGAVLFGVADILPLTDSFFLSPDEIKGLKYGVVAGVLLSPTVLNGIEDKPTLLYKWHYRQANNLLDKIAFELTQSIIREGFNALPIPSSQMIDWKDRKGHVSHRTLAVAAGLGWRGKNNLLVHEKYGARLRLVSILTDLPLLTDKPVDPQCEACSRCVKACPVGALGNTPEEYDIEKCTAILREFSKLQGIGQMICGICVKACNGKGK